MTESITRSASGTPLPPPKERRRLREAKFLSEDEVATTIGVTRATIRSWETGRTAPRGRNREAYAELLAALDTRTGECAPDTGPLEGDREPDKRDEVDGGGRAAGEGLDQDDRVRIAPPTRTAQPTANTRPRPAVKRAAKPPVALHPRPVGRPGPSSATAPPADSRRGVGPLGPAALTLPPPSPEEAFDVLYAGAAPDLVRQTYLLTGRRRLSQESVERAFHHAWQRWPEVAVDRDPAGWVRAVAYEYAMSPWNRLRPAHRYPDELPGEEPRRELLEALLELPTAYRRALLLHDGLGLGLPETAAETEASTPATASRLVHAREAMAERLPELADSSVLRDRMRGLAGAGPAPLMTPACDVRSGCERRAKMWTRAVAAATALIVAATAFTLVTAPRHYDPPISPAQQIEGVPAPQHGPHRLTEKDRALRDKLRSEPANGPGRLVPLRG
ncbi:helix-turn-helix domain-containing protein [Streptomyces sp. Tu 2975]|uniref:sigma factor-like helix-turn-helix DNA-binding protein n=1 Tax=Streptomyces sp. Tu 2975 TaxID=2676871 RepID=UPI0013581EE5|nr:sigma factor-like helix-turn-helix DNA-binding protein [Streptomyces sp. Tu 2975]QIP85067.1 helix-turn-helix domain-containing protein [Streptomyces sp. Tu 2975]